MKSKTTTTRKEMSQGMMAVLFSAPAVLIIAVTILVPFGMAVFLSLHSWNLKRPGRERFIGLENYIDWLTDSDFWEPLRTTFTFAILAVVLIVIVSLLIALLLNEKFPGRGMLRALLLVPWAIPSVVNALLWKWLLDPSYGLINAVLKEIGLITVYQAWLSEMPGVMIWLVIAYSWIHIPLATLLLLSRPADHPRRYLRIRHRRRRQRLAALPIYYPAHAAPHALHRHHLRDDLCPQSLRYHLCIDRRRSR